MTDTKIRFENEFNIFYDIYLFPNIWCKWLQTSQSSDSIGAVTAESKSVATQVESDLTLH